MQSRRDPTLASRYRLLQLLGRGGMGVVFKAHDAALNETVAVKVLSSGVGHLAEGAERFRSEIRLARRVRHPNVCAINEYGRDETLEFIVMEFVEGSDLKEVLRERGPLAAAEACTMALRIAEALHAVHEAGILHRDLKSRNVMQGRDGVVRLMDFGLAKRVAGEASASPELTETGRILGTPDYMSPEQARGERLDVRSDVYSLGVVLFELLTARLPFAAPTPLLTLFHHINTPPPLEGPEAATIPPPLREVLRRALAKDPSERFSSARELVGALRQAEEGLMPGPEESANPTAVGGSVRLPVRALFLVGLGLATTIFIVIVSGWPSSSAPRPASPAPAVRPNPESQSRPASTPSPASAAPASAAPTAPQARKPRPAEAQPANPVAGANEGRLRPRSEEEAPLSAHAPAPPELPAATVARTGHLRLLVIPWAEVSVDDRRIGTTPMRALELPVGTHAIRLSHPDYGLLVEEVSIQAGETTRLEIDLTRSRR